MIYVSIWQRDASAQSTEPITTGSVGLMAGFSFSEDWRGLGKTAVFRGSGVQIDAALMAERCKVPHEVLSRAGGHLKIGVYGTGESGQRVTPTVWADAGEIREGAEPAGIEETPATASLVQQLLEEAQAARELAQSVRDDADAGEFAGPEGPTGQQGPAGRDGAAGSGIWTCPSSDFTNNHRVRCEKLIGREDLEPAPGDLVLADGRYLYRISQIVEDWEPFRTYLSAVLQQQGDLKGPQGDAGPQGEPGELTREALYTVFATDSASGPVASFSDGADMVPVKDLSIVMEPVQAGSGDPSPSNVRPITGWMGAKVQRTGKNLFDKNDPDVMHGYAVSTTSGTLYTASSGIWSASGFMPVKGGNQYIISGDNAANDLAFYDANKVFISGTSDGSRAITAPANACYARMDYTIANEDRIQFEQSSAATAYEAYQGTSCAIPFPTEAGTVYSGTLDVTTGKLCTEWVMYDGGDLDWTKVSNSNYRNFYAKAPDVLLYANNVSSILSSAYKSTNNNASTATDDFYVWATALQPNNTISVKDTAKESMTAAEFKAAMAGVQFLCMLKTSIEHILTPTEVKTILGENNIWADCGDSTVEYRADTKLYIDKKIAALAAAMN